MPFVHTQGSESTRERMQSQAHVKRWKYVGCSQTHVDLHVQADAYNKARLQARWSKRPPRFASLLSFQVASGTGSLLITETQQNKSSFFPQMPSSPEHSSVQNNSFDGGSSQPKTSNPRTSLVQFCTIASATGPYCTSLRLLTLLFLLYSAASSAACVGCCKSKLQFLLHYTVYAYTWFVVHRRSIWTYTGRVSLLCKRHTELTNMVVAYPKWDKLLELVVIKENDWLWYN